MLKKFFYALVSVAFTMLIAALAIFWLAQNTLQQPLQLTQEESINVQQGATPLGLLSQLERDRVIQGSLWLRILWRAQQHQPGLQIGEYILEPGMSLAQLLEKWRVGDVHSYQLTLVEGWTFARFRQVLAQQELLEQTLSGLSTAEVMQLLGRPGLHPEGRFYPDTYQFVRGQSDVDILRRSLQRLEQVLEEEWQERADNLPYTSADEALIMASIIERETGVAHERSEIAGVFVRRLQLGMRLQTDPTVIYGMGERYQGRITRADLRRPTAYNTYTIDGLPPTPIAMVGREAIHAALHPAEGDSLYFVARGDGTHQFSRTLREHNRAVREYQLNRRSDYRSTVAPASSPEEKP